MANAVVTFNNLVDIVPRDQDFPLDFSISKPDSVSLTENISYTSSDVTDYSEYNVQAIIEIDKSKWESITNFDINETKLMITGLRKVFYRYKVYIEETNTILKNFSPFYNQAVHDTSIIITDDNFKTWNPYSVKVLVEQDNAVNVTGSKSFSVYDTSPYVSLFTVVDNMINLQVADYELDKMKLKMTLNGQHAYPSIGDYTDFKSSPFNLSLKVPKDLLLVNQTNTLMLYAKDSFEKELSPLTVTFTGEYQEMLFYDLLGNVYTDGNGNINKLIDLGFVTSGNKSAITHIKIKNKLGFDVNQLRINLYTDTIIKTGNIPEKVGYNTIPQFTDVKFATNEAALVDGSGVSELYFPEIFRNGDERDIYFQVTSEVLAMGRGSFRINAKAIPV